MISIIDYDAGNLSSVVNAFKYIGCDATVTDDRKTILRSDKVVLPGVGSFGDAMTYLDRKGLSDVIKETVSKGIPFLGICLGMQLIFEKSEESPGCEGLGLIDGGFLKFESRKDLKVPQVGWNDLEHTDNKGFFGEFEGEYFYFVHSFYLPECKWTGAETFYGKYYTSAIEKDNILACQFHPEKSGDAGLDLLRKFARYF